MARDAETGKDEIVTTNSRHVSNVFPQYHQTDEAEQTAPVYNHEDLNEQQHGVDWERHVHHWRNPNPSTRMTMMNFDPSVRPYMGASPPPPTVIAKIFSPRLQRELKTSWRTSLTQKIDLALQIVGREDNNDSQHG